jgi:hypothetical protein
MVCDPTPAHVFVLPLTLYLPCAVWTGVRVAEGAGLENRYTRKGIVGSNPTLSVLLQELGSYLEVFAKLLPISR